MERAVSHPDPSPRASTDCITPKGWRFVECTGGGAWWQVLRCRQCAGCWAWWRARVAGRIAEIAGASQGVYLVTLTTRGTPSGGGGYHYPAWPVIMRRFASLWKRIRKDWGPGVSYAAVKEQGGRTGMRHLHVVVIAGPERPDGMAPRPVSRPKGSRTPWETSLAQELASMWEDRIGAWVVDVEEVLPGLGGGQVAYYVAKYLAKGEVRFARKLVSYSRGFQLRVSGERVIWEREHRSPHGWRFGLPIIRPAMVWRGVDVQVERPCAVCRKDLDWPSGATEGMPVQIVAKPAHLFYNLGRRGRDPRHTVVELARKGVWGDC